MCLRKCTSKTRQACEFAVQWFQYSLHKHLPHMRVQVAKRDAPLEFCAAPAVKHSRPSYPGDAGGFAQEVPGASQDVLERISLTSDPMSRILSASLGQIQVCGGTASSSRFIIVCFTQRSQRCTQRSQ